MIIMELQNLIDKYISHLYDNSYNTRGILRYQSLLNIFYEYLIIQNSLNSTTLISYLNGITPEAILNSVDYYISKGAYSEDTVGMYVSVIREFFRYIKNILDIGNDDLIKSFGLSKRDQRSFAFKYQSYLSKLLTNGTIQASKHGVPFTDEQVRSLVKFCDEHIVGPDISKISDREYDQYVKSLAVKLISYLGVSIDVLNNILVNHLDLERGTIIISGFRLHLPYHLRNQAEVYKDKFRKNSSNNTLFVLSDGKCFDQANKLGIYISNCFRYDSSVQNPSSVTSLAKYAIIQLIDAGIDRDTIRDLTGYKDEIYESCKQLIDLPIKSKQIDGIVKQLPAFDYL